MTRRRPFTADEIALCRSWRNAGVSWARIAVRLETTPDLLRVAADPGFAERRLSRRRVTDRVSKPRKVPRPAEVVAAAPEPVPTPAAYIMALHKRGLGETRIAALVRQPYRVVSEVIARSAAR